MKEIQIWAVNTYIYIWPKTKIEREYANTFSYYLWVPECQWLITSALYLFLCISQMFQEKKKKTPYNSLGRKASYGAARPLWKKLLVQLAVHLTA